VEKLGCRELVTAVLLGAAAKVVESVEFATVGGYVGAAGPVPVVSAAAELETAAVECGDVFWAEVGSDVEAERKNEAAAMT
jgi:hypothetical protein